MICSESRSNHHRVCGHFTPPAGPFLSPAQHHLSLFLISPGSHLIEHLEWLFFRTLLHHTLLPLLTAVLHQTPVAPRSHGQDTQGLLLGARTSNATCCVRGRRRVAHRPPAQIDRSIGYWLPSTTGMHAVSWWHCQHWHKIIQCRSGLICMIQLAFARGRAA